MAEPGKSLGEEKAVFELSVAHCVFNHFCTTYLQSVFFSSSPLMTFVITSLSNKSTFLINKTT